MNDRIIRTVGGCMITLGLVYAGNELMLQSHSAGIALVIAGVGMAVFSFGNAATKMNRD